MDKKYLIGGFSDRTGISKRMLRHYDKLDLFKPVTLDEENGYRYYDESQVVQVEKIQFLKDLGFTLTAIKDLLSESLDVYGFTELLKSKEVELTKASDEVKSNLLLLKRTILYLEKQTPNTFPSIDQLLNLEGSKAMTINELVDLKQLMNRDVFTEKIEEILERDQNDHYHFITFDIDHFMHINDYDGYDVGDAVIAHVFTLIINKVNALIEKTHKEVLIARLGGDECSIFIKNADHDQVIQCVETIFSDMRSFDFKTTGCSQKVTVSCGVATHNGKPIHVAQLKDESTKALIQAKRDGRNQYVVFSLTMR